MKVGDKVPVTIAGQTVAQAQVKEMGDGTVSLVVPATLVVMATRTEISTPAPVEQETETIITGVDRTTGETESETVSEQPSVTTNVGESTTVDTTAVTTSAVEAPAPTPEPAASETVSPSETPVQDSPTVVETAPVVAVEVTNESE